MKNKLNQLLGHGPFFVVPIEAFEELRHDARKRGLLTMPENFDGLLKRTICPSYSIENVEIIFGKPSSTSIESNGFYRPSGIAPEISISLYSLSDACITGEGGAIYCPEKRALVAESAIGWLRGPDRHPVLNAIRLKKPRPINGCSLSLIGVGGSSFYHIIHDLLPRYAFSEESGLYFDHFILSDFDRDVATPWLKAVGFPMEKAIWVNPLENLRCEQLCFIPHPHRHSNQPNPWATHTVRRVFGLPKSSEMGQRWIWLTRTAGMKRHARWEESFIRTFPRFEVVNLANYSPEDQINLFREAGVVAGPHGASFANLCFAGTGAKALEIFPEDFPYLPLYGRISAQVGVNHAAAFVSFSGDAHNDRFAEACRIFLEEDV